MNERKYVVLSLELHLFFARIMKEHGIFLEAGFTCKDSNYAKKADHYKKEFEKLLCCALSASNCMIRPSVLNSGELFTEYTIDAEQKTQYLTGIEINTDITVNELNLQSGDSSHISHELIDYVKQLNSNALKLVEGIIDFKKKVLTEMLSCKLFTSNYPLLIEHIMREARLYRSYIIALENGQDIDYDDAKESELFWDQIMMEHALFIRGLLDPTENDLINASNNFANDYSDLIAKAKKMTDATISNVTDETLNKTIELKEFKTAGTKGSIDCQIRSIFVPLLADHVLRESNHYIRLLKGYKDMM